MAGRRLGFFRLTVVCLLLAICAGAPAGAVASPGSGSGSSPASLVSAWDYCPDGEELAFLDAINEYRSWYGLSPLTLSSTLGAAARHHSIEMANQNYFDHTLPDGTSWLQNIVNHGYNYNTYMGENIAAGYAGAGDALWAWDASPGHQANMLDPNFTTIGIGRAYNGWSSYGWYWTTTFGGVDDGGPSC